MVKLPDVSKGKALAVTLATVVGPKVVEFLQDPRRAEQARLLVEQLTPALQRPTPDARLATKIAAVRDHLDGLPADGAEAAQRTRWRERLTSLDSKRGLVVAAYTGRERRRQLKTISGQVDDLLLELLRDADDDASS